LGNNQHALFMDWSKKTILIAEDEIINYRYLEVLLKDKVQRIDHAINGLEAVEMASKNNYALVLMDLKMPLMDGIEATRIIKQQFPKMPVIAQTAYAMPEEKNAAIQAGCDEFISKPIKKDALMALISKILG
jgi:CheY-like chemotaxis protein